MEKEEREAINLVWEAMYQARDPARILRGMKTDTGFWVVTPKGRFHIQVGWSTLQDEEE